MIVSIMTALPTSDDRPLLNGIDMLLYVPSAAERVGIEISRMQGFTLASEGEVRL